MTNFDTLFPDNRLSKEDPLDQAKLILLRILKIVDFICDENNLDYWLDYGTLLGAVRHKGFIPWDDDIDIAMPRKSYEKLIAMADEVFPKDIFLQTKQSDPAQRKGIRWLKIRDRYSSAIETHEVGKDIKYHQGLGIDVFPVEEFDKPKTYLKAKKFTYSRFHIISKNKLAPFFNKLIRTEEGKYLASGLEVDFMAYFPREDVYPLSKIEFENEIFFAPNNPHNVLTSRYGDYMVIPEKEDRFIHNSITNPTTPCSHSQSLDWDKRS
jgi:lipopolysaccharide cholinephosphotransferase